MNRAPHSRNPRWPTCGRIRSTAASISSRRSDGADAQSIERQAVSVNACRPVFWSNLYAMKWLSSKYAKYMIMKLVCVWSTWGATYEFYKWDQTHCFARCLVGCAIFVRKEGAPLLIFLPSSLVEGCFSVQQKTDIIGMGCSKGQLGVRASAMAPDWTPRCTEPSMHNVFLQLYIWLNVALKEKFWAAVI